jgi:hypothetical protein
VHGVALVCQVAVFSMYLLIAAGKGNFKFGSRFFFITVRTRVAAAVCGARRCCGTCLASRSLSCAAGRTLAACVQIHPMEAGKTLVNSFLFNLACVRPQ